MGSRAAIIGNHYKYLKETFTFHLATKKSVKEEKKYVIAVNQLCDILAWYIYALETVW